MIKGNIKLVLFDLGGVLVELGDEIFPQSWIGDDCSFKLEQWFKSDIAARFETGLISPDKFIGELKRELSISASHQQVRSAFESWPRGLFSSTDELLNRLKMDYKIAVLSNSNEIHEPILMQKFGLESRIETFFYSHLIALSKPNIEAFKYVLNALNVEPREVIFFDDNAANVFAARRLGIIAHQVSSPDDVANYI